MWTELPLTMNFTVPLCGGVPRQDEIVAKWVEIRAATDAAHAKLENPKTLEEVKEERLATMDPLPGPPPIPGSDEEELADALAQIPKDQEAMDKVWCGFSRDHTGLFVRGGSLRAHLKACAGVLGKDLKSHAVGPVKPIKNFRAKCVERVYVKEEHVHLLNGNGGAVTETTGYRDATLSVMTAQGPRTCLKRIDYVFPVTIKATIMLWGVSEITRDCVVLLLEYGKVQGFNQDRSLQYGRYEYELGE